MAEEKSRIVPEGLRDASSIEELARKTQFYYFGNIVISQSSFMTLIS